MTTRNKALLSGILWIGIGAATGAFIYEVTGFHILGPLVGAIAIACGIARMAEGARSG